MGGIAGHDLGICACNRHVRLFEWSNVVQLAKGQILDRSVHTRNLREHEDTRVLAAVRCRNVSNLKLQWHIVCSLDLPVSQCVCNNLGLLRGAEAQDATIKLYNNT